MSAATEPRSPARSAPASRPGARPRVWELAFKALPDLLHPRLRSLVLGVLLGQVLAEGIGGAQPQLPHRHAVADRPGELRDRPGARRDAVADGRLHRVHHPGRGRERGLPRGVRRTASAGSTASSRSTSRTSPRCPSIVYGVLGLAFLVRGPLGLGHVLLAGGLTLGLLVLPVLIVAGREAIRAVPPSIREGSMALGATKWQTIWKQVLPAALPGIATGAILSLSRAIGETAPLIVIGAAAFATSSPSGDLRRRHRAADPDLQLDLRSPGGVQGARRRGDHRPDGDPAGDERGRDLAAQQIREEVVGD